MKIALLGTGVVAKTLAPALRAAGHEVNLGSRRTDNNELAAWAAENLVTYNTFSEAVTKSELAINATAGMASLEALTLAGKDALAGKVILDLTNPLDFSNGFPPTLSVKDTDSLAEQIQRAFPESWVVKTLNTVSCNLMIAPEKVPGNHQLPICFSDEAARDIVVKVLKDLGWQDEQFIFLTDLSMARGTEMYLALWVRLYGLFNTDLFNFEFRKA